MRVASISSSTIVRLTSAVSILKGDWRTCAPTSFSACSICDSFASFLKDASSSTLTSRVNRRTCHAGPHHRHSWSDLQLWDLQTEDPSVKDQPMAGGSQTNGRGIPNQWPGDPKPMAGGSSTKWPIPNAPWDASASVSLNIPLVSRKGLPSRGGRAGAGGLGRVGWGGWAGTGGLGRVGCFLLRLLLLLLLPAHLLRLAAQPMGDSVEDGGYVAHDLFGLQLNRLEDAVEGLGAPHARAPHVRDQPSP